MKLKFIFAFLLIFALLFYYVSGVSSDYIDSSVETEERGILNRTTGELVVKPAVIDYEIDSQFYYGYRLPSIEVECEESKYKANILELKPVYFILKLDNGEVTEYTSRVAFELILQSHNIELGSKFKDIEKNQLVLHYKEIYKTFDFYSDCTQLSQAQ